jgi:hypothetical protein
VAESTDLPEEQLPEGAERVPDEQQAAVDAKEKEVLGKILDAAASDPGFKDRMLNDPDAALGEIGVAEDVDLLDRGPQSADVAGQYRYHTKWVVRCFNYRTRRKWYHWS